MAPDRLKPTLADYLAIALSPALIMVLVGSLAFFLLEIFYSGAFEQRLQWTTLCFVFAAVLISRVSIEEGAERASLFGLALGVAAALAMTRFTDHPWGAWVVLAVIWWCASHLVWNCTLVDDEQDATGEGLLEAAGLDPPRFGAPAAAVPTIGKRSRAGKRRQPAPVPAPAETPPQPALKRLFAWWQGRRGQALPPGLTVVYFSLAALPIFGLGQALVRPDGRRFVFLLATAYVGAALGLLLSTSFLGLRRYLRQRRLEMPGEMAGAWLTVGGSLAVAILIVAALIPRPNPEYAISSLSGVLGSPQREASRRAVLRDSPAQGDSATSAPANEQSPSDEKTAAQAGPGPTPGANAPGGAEPGKAPGSGPSPGGQASNSGAPQGNTSDPDRKSGESRTANSGRPQSQAERDEQAGKRNGQNTPAATKPPGPASQQPAGTPEPQQPPAERESSGAVAQSPAQASPAQSSPSSSSTPRNLLPQLPSGMGLLPIVKWILYAVVILALLYGLLRYWREVAAWIAQLWRELVSLWQSLFGGRTAAVEGNSAAPAASGGAARPFASYRDPFLSGEAGRHAPAIVVQYSFEALEAWGAERGLARGADETPLEFAARIGDHHEPLAACTREVASLYAQVAYARQALSAGNLAPVERFWQRLRRAADEVAPAVADGAAVR